MLKAHSKKLSTSCIDCGAVIEFDEQPLLGEFVYCPECDATLEVASLRPLKLTVAYDDLEDVDDMDDLYWDDDDDWGDMPVA